MSEVIDRAIEELSARVTGGFDSSAKFVIDDEGSIVVDGAGVRAGNDETDVTLSADLDTFRQIMSGDLNPASAVMQGRLRIDGDMSIAMKLGSVLS